MRRIQSPRLTHLLWYVVILLLRTSPVTVFNIFILFERGFIFVSPVIYKGESHFSSFPGDFVSTQGV